MMAFLKGLAPIGLGAMIWYIGQYQSFVLAFVVFAVGVLYSLAGIEQRLDRIAHSLDANFERLRHLQRWDNDIDA